MGKHEATVFQKVTQILMDSGVNRNAAKPCRQFLKISTFQNNCLLDFYCIKKNMASP